MKNALKKILHAISKGKIDFAGKNYNKLKPINKNFTEQTIYYPVQAHNYVEIIFNIQGQINIFINNCWQIYKPSKAIVLLPRVLHSERYKVRNTPYQLLWLIIAPTSCYSHITSYNKEKGYHIVKRTPVISDKSERERLHQLACEISKTNSRLSKIKFQANLMTMIACSLENMDNHSFHNLSVTEQVINQIKYYIDCHYNEHISLAKLAAMSHYNPCYLNTLFKKHIGIPINKYIIEVRLSKAEELLSHADLEIKQIAYKVGFDDPLYFSRIFSHYRGLSPSKYRADIIKI